MLLVLATQVCAQGYNTAVGLRVGRSGGVSAAQRLSKHSSAEAHLTAGIFDDGFTLTLLARRHVPLIVKKANLFVGGGVHKGWNYSEEEGNSGVFKKGDPFGLDGQVGAEVTLGRTNVALDYMLQINLSGELSAIRPPGAAITVRYVIDKRENKLRIRAPWNTEEEAKANRKARKNRKKAREKAKRKGEYPSLRERLFGKS